jgi:Raf kinase inhibitor-like YbhB/YbcL family protein
VHWVVYKIPPTVHALQEQLPRQSQLASPPIRQGLNYLRHPGYDGPAPPKGHGVHHYHFKLYALDKYLDPTDGIDGRAFYTAIAGHVLDEGELVGTYERG